MTTNKIKISIFGGGLSGLTVAHELLDRGFEVSLYESDKKLGGMAQSQRDHNGVPTEHSWRSYAPFYHNFHDIASRIPLNKGETVIQGLSRPLHFHLLKDKRSTIYHKKAEQTVHIKDFFVLAYFLLKSMVSNRRRQQDKKVLFRDSVGPYLTQKGKDCYDKFVVSAWGLDTNGTSHDLFFRFGHPIFLQGYRHVKITRDKRGLYLRHPFQYWNVMTRPTDEGFITPWVSHLKKKGLKIYLQHSLTKIILYPDGKTVKYCLVKNNHQQVTKVTSDDYVMAINPYHLTTIISASRLQNQCRELSKFQQLTNQPPYDQISFRLGFKRKIHFPKSEIGFFLPDSPFQIIFYPQDSVWERSVNLGKDIKSLWSGTVCAFRATGVVYHKLNTQLDKSEYLEEIITQLFRNQDLDQIIYKTNGFHITRQDISYSEIWNKWKYNGKGLVTSEPEWINYSRSDPYRPKQKSEIKNLYLVGAHTKTTIDIWTMEGAIESGKIASNHLLEKYQLAPIYRYQHNDPLAMKYIQFLDDGLYKLGLPNLIDIIIVLIIIVVIVFIAYLMLKLKIKKK